MLTILNPTAQCKFRITGWPELLSMQTVDVEIDIINSKLVVHVQHTTERENLLLLIRELRRQPFHLSIVELLGVDNQQERLIINTSVRAVQHRLLLSYLSAECAMNEITFKILS